jgi:hypothetical protein
MYLVPHSILIQLCISWICSLKVVDCHMCGDPNSVLRFAFIEFTNEGNISISNYVSVYLLCVMDLLKQI